LLQDTRCLQGKKRLQNKNRNDAGEAGERCSIQESEDANPGEDPRSRWRLTVREERDRRRGRKGGYLETLVWEVRVTNPSPSRYRGRQKGGWALGFLSCAATQVQGTKTAHKTENYKKTARPSQISMDRAQQKGKVSSKTRREQNLDKKGIKVTVSNRQSGLQVSLFRNTGGRRTLSVNKKGRKRVQGGGERRLQKQKKGRILLHRGRWATGEFWKKIQRDTSVGGMQKSFQGGRTVPGIWTGGRIEPGVCEVIGFVWGNRGAAGTVHQVKGWGFKS